MSTFATDKKEEREGGAEAGGIKISRSLSAAFSSYKNVGEHGAPAMTCAEFHFNSQKQQGMFVIVYLSTAIMRSLCRLCAGPVEKGWKSSVAVCGHRCKTSIINILFFKNHTLYKAPIFPYKRVLQVIKEFALSGDKATGGTQILAPYDIFQKRDCIMVVVDLIADDFDRNLIAADAKIGFDHNTSF